FLLAPHIEIIETPLPKVFFVHLVFRELQRQLVGRSSSSSPQRRGNLLLQHLQNLGRVSFEWFGQQQMDMFRHYHITNHLETMPRADLIENFHEPVARSSRSQQRTTAITAKRDEMKIASPIMSLQGITHGLEGLHFKRKPAPLNAKGAAPRVSEHRW